MGKVLNLFDGLRSALTGTGTARDARTSYDYAFRALTQPEIAAAYSGSGLLRKICQIPALDMVREWRTWNGLEADQVAEVYAEEKRIGLVGLVRQAEVLRALGGGALIMGLPGDPTQPAAPNAPLSFVHVVSRWHLTFAKLQDDATKPGFGEPEMWTMNTTAGNKNIHPSRVIPFRADRTASLAMPTLGSADAFWGESTVAQVLDAVKDSDAARAAFAALLHKAKTMRIGIPKLYEMVAAGEDQKVFDRLAILATAESMHNAVVFDNGDDEGKGGEAITDAEYNFAGAKDMLYAYGEFVAAISDIPATRLLGRAPEGMNASGDSQQKDWQKKVRAMQELDLTPCLDRLDPHLLAAAGASATNANATWDPLDTPSEKENAERFKTQMEAIDKLQATAAIPDEAFNRGVQSLMVEEGYLPELELALSKLGDEERYGIGLPDDPPSKGGDPVSPGEGGADDVPPRLAANDAAPRTLYVSRKVENRADLQRWATEQGLGELQPDLHVTIAYSRTPVDWMKVEDAWIDEDDGGLLIKPGGPRVVEPLGDRTAVLMFSSSHLAYRHERIRRDAGASWDWPDYQPHISLTGDPVDLSSVEPYRGKIELGPEIFEEIDEGRE
jgi:phage-related protein (TIGR01555 family)